MKELLCALIFIAEAAFGQSPPAFEVASVKPSLPPGAPGRSIRVAGPFMDAGRVSWWNIPLRFYTMQAYGVTIAWRIEGGPGWFASDNFDVTATFPVGTPAEQIPLMLKTLLTERFRLAAHVESRPRDIYALTVAKTGLRIQESAADKTPPGNRMGGGHMEQHRVTLHRLADLLSGTTQNMSGRPVVDMTGLKGLYDLTLDWAPDDGPADTGKPSLFTAVTEQLGLRLEVRKAPVDILVIDHAERPSEN